MGLCKCGHIEARHTDAGCNGCTARCKEFQEAVVTGEARIKQQEEVVAELKQPSEPEARPLNKGKATRVWRCIDCDTEYDTKKDAKDCCGSEEPPVGSWKCSECDLDNRYDTKAEAEECDCEESETSGGSSIGIGGIMQMMIMCLVLIFVVSIGATILASVAAQASPNDSSLLSQAATQTYDMIKNIGGFIPIAVAVGVLIVVVSGFSTNIR